QPRFAPRELLTETTAARPHASRPPESASRAHGARLFTLGKKTRPKLSGWAQKAKSDKKLRKAKATAGTRLLALTLATQVSAAGELRSGGQDVALELLAAQVSSNPASCSTWSTS
ncbi:hypothetical protein AB0D83_19815, partial [Streptomyces decoyicus]